MFAYQKVPNVERVLSVRREPYFNLGQIWLKKVEGVGFGISLLKLKNKQHFSEFLDII